jgi:hypothetical protein
MMKFIYFVMNFHRFANIRKAININKRFFLVHFLVLKSYNFTMDSKFLAKYKNILTNLYFHIWLIAKTWLILLMDDFEIYF